MLKMFLVQLTVSIEHVKLPDMNLNSDSDICFKMVSL